MLIRKLWSRYLSLIWKVFERNGALSDQLEGEHTTHLENAITLELTLYKGFSHLHLWLTHQNVSPLFSSCGAFDFTKSRSRNILIESSHLIQHICFAYQTN